jgi:hypothetical protein
MSCEGLYEGRKEKGTQGEEIFTKQIFNKKKNKHFHWCYRNNFQNITRKNTNTKAKYFKSKMGSHEQTFHKHIKANMTRY